MSRYIDKDLLIEYIKDLPSEGYFDAKYKVGDQVWTAGYYEGYYYASRHSYVIDNIQIKITARSVFVTYELHNGNARFTEPEDLLFPTHDACVRWCQSQNILGE